MTKSDQFKEPEEEPTSDVEPPENCPFCKAEVMNRWEWSVRYDCYTIGYRVTGKFGKNCKG